MATYRNIQLSFWTDAKVADEFTPEDKYFFLYLLTNPHTNTCGCYELSLRQMSIETGYSQETIERLLTRFALIHDIVRYSSENRELLVINWHKYNWTKSDRLRTSIANSIKAVKTQAYKEYLIRCFNGFLHDEEIDATIEKECTFTIEKSTQTEEIVEVKPKKKTEPVKHRYGEYKHVRLSDDEYNRLANEYGEDALLQGIKKVDEYCQEHGKSYVDYNLTLRKWGIGTPKIKDRQLSDTGQVRRTLQ